MATTAEHKTELAMTLRLSRQASERLSQCAAASGKDVAAVASDLLEQAITRSSLDEILAPFRKQVAESNMSDDELDGFFQAELDAMRQEKRAKSA